MLIGTLFGLVLGFITSIVPGMHISVIYLWIVQTQEPYFAIGLILGSYGLSSILQNSQQLIELCQAADPLAQQNLSRAKKINKVVDCIYLSAEHEFFGFFFIAAVGGIWYLFSTPDQLISMKEELKVIVKILAPGFAILLWLYFILNAKSRVLAALTIVLAGVLGLTATHNGNPYAFVSLSISLFVIAPGIIPRLKKA